MFQMNEGKSIAKWSESPIEGWNKYVRSFQSGPTARSRQMSVKTSIHDIFKRMLITSHPIIASRRHRPTSQICGEHGHFARAFIHKSNNTSVHTDKQRVLESMYRI